MEEALDQYKKYLPVILLIFYALGYVNLSNYYSAFNVPIEYYINLTDMLMYAIGRLVSITGTFIVTELILIIPTYFIIKKCQDYEINKLLKKSNKETKVNNRFKRIHSRNIPEGSYSALSAFILLIALGILIHKAYEPWVNYIIIFIFLKFSIILTNKIKETTFYLFRSAIVIIPTIFVFWITGIDEANKVVNSNNTKNISFESNDLLYTTTDKSHIFIGETSGYIFLYNPKHKETEIFQKTNISELKIKNEHYTKEESAEIVKKWEENIKNFFSF